MGWRKLALVCILGALTCVLAGYDDPVDTELLKRCYEEHAPQVLQRFSKYEWGWARTYLKGKDNLPDHKLLYFPIPKAMSGTLR
eukprot:CAMPEP_0198730274 /NCGR_PEP_ID=MMETSP1475-20131203/23716_1 /TAXON_ID= ORGANISM="Unidentified sp., Strain CCMP1999" /NCGR_SAMPLE_ID=MMETSP1475 /ASSEMBLY_ACC=CAM_ASM_001111 /LENGTH=83 /DNA_ID=CAMNT_0044493061 /DNA_START=15 /DNA_END=262 /DNA_ORIENTATION=+